MKSLLLLVCLFAVGFSFAQKDSVLNEPIYSFSDVSTPREYKMLFDRDVVLDKNKNRINGWLIIEDSIRILIYHLVDGKKDGPFAEYVQLDTAYRLSKVGFAKYGSDWDEFYLGEPIDKNGFYFNEYPVSAAYIMYPELLEGSTSYHEMRVKVKRGKVQIIEYHFYPGLMNRVYKNKHYMRQEEENFLALKVDSLKEYFPYYLEVNNEVLTTIRYSGYYSNAYRGEAGWLAIKFEPDHTLKICSSSSDGNYNWDNALIQKFRLNGNEFTTYDNESEEGHQVVSGKFYKGVALSVKIRFPDGLYRTVGLTYTSFNSTEK